MASTWEVGSNAPSAAELALAFFHGCFALHLSCRQSTHQLYLQLSLQQDLHHRTPIVLILVSCTRALWSSPTAILGIDIKFLYSFKRAPHFITQSNEKNAVNLPVSNLFDMQDHANADFSF